MDNHPVSALALECKVAWNPQTRSYFVLGYSEHPETFDSQLMWPKEIWPLAILCNQCFRLSEYSEQDIRKLPLDNGHLHRLPKKIWNITVQCDRENCGFRAEIYLQTDISEVKDRMMLTYDAKPEICCPFVAVLVAGVDRHDSALLLSFIDCELYMAIVFFLSRSFVFPKRSYPS